MVARLELNLTISSLRAISVLYEQALLDIDG